LPRLAVSALRLESGALSDAAERSKLRAGLDALRQAVERRPLATACGILLTKGVFCDLLVQTVVEGKRFEQDSRPTGAQSGPGAEREARSSAAPAVSWTRTAILGVYSGFCEAPLAYLVYARLFPRWFPATAGVGWPHVGKMLAVDSLMLWPLMIYPTYYASEAVVEFLAAEREGEAPSEAPLEERFGAKLLSSLRRYFTVDFLEVNQGSMMVWVPVGIVNFGYIPAGCRTSFMGAVAFFYTTFWSFQQSQFRQRRLSEASLSRPIPDA
jgi:hypothetical protein